MRIALPWPRMISWNSPSVCSDRAKQFRSFFTIKPKAPASLPVLPVPVLLHEGQMVDHNANEICRGYFSDVSSEGEDINWADDKDDSLDLDVAPKPINHPLSTQNIVSPPLPKRRKLEIPARTMRAQAKQVHLQELNSALLDIQKLISSKKNPVCSRHKWLAVQTCTFGRKLPVHGCQQ